MRMIILAAGTGSRLAPLTDDRPKCMVPLAGKPILEWTLAAADRHGVSDITLIGGYRIDQLARYGLDLVENPEFAATNMVYTLLRARDRFAGGFVMSYGDIAYAPQVLERLLAAAGDGISVVVDRDWRAYWEARSDDPLADAETMKVEPDGRIRELGAKPKSMDEIEGQYIGLVHFGPRGVEALTALVDKLAATPQDERRRDPRRMYMTDLIQALIDSGEPVRAVDIHGGWVEVDNADDLALATRLVAEGRLAGQGARA